jgi:hypothetical protein
VHLLVSELRRIQNARCNDKNYTYPLYEPEDTSRTVHNPVTQPHSAQHTTHMPLYGKPVTLLLVYLHIFVTHTYIYSYPALI